MIGVFVFLLGGIVGSIINLLVERISNEEDILDVLKGSGWIHKCIWGKLPEKSNLFFMGISGVVFLLLYWKFGMGLLFMKNVIAICFLILIGGVDFRTKYVYTALVWTGIILMGITVILEFLCGMNITTYLLGMGIGLAVFSFIMISSKILYKKNGIGLGDLEVIILMGLTLGGGKLLMAVFMAIVSAGILCGILLILKLIDRKDYIPFVPFLTGGTVFVILWGERIWNWYMGIVLM